MQRHIEMNLAGAQPIPDATAIVLAGGKSSRMGRPKSLLPFDNEPLIVHIVRALNRIFAETVSWPPPGTGDAFAAGHVGAG